MGTGALSSLGVRARAASYSQLQTTGHNISNANTPGYSRQEAQLQTAGGQFTGAGFFGRGVDVTTVARAHDDFLTREAALSKAQASFDTARSEQLQRLEKVFTTGETGLGYTAAQFFSAFADIANKPQDESGRQVALSQAGQLASRFNAAADHGLHATAGTRIEHDLADQLDGCRQFFHACQLRAQGELAWRCLRQENAAVSQPLRLASSTPSGRPS